MFANVTINPHYYLIDFCEGDKEDYIHMASLKLSQGIQKFAAMHITKIFVVCKISLQRVY